MPFFLSLSPPLSHTYLYTYIHHTYLFSGNSFFGYLILKVKNLTNTKVVWNCDKMRKILENPRLDNFTLVSDEMMLANLRPVSRYYDVLLPLGVHVLLESKLLLLEKWYFSLKPALSLSPLIKNVTLIYVDTVRYSKIQ